MIPVVSVSQMRRIDQAAIAGNVQTGFSYMLKAGAGLTEAARKMVPDPAAGDIAIFCGRGNNGGDGYMAGSMLVDAGYRIMCYGLCDATQLSGEARIAYAEYMARKGNFLLLDDTFDLENLSRFVLIVDAILGTGIKGNPRGLAAEVIRAINNAAVPVLSVDTPSGLNNDTGEPGDPCITAHTTVTMGFPKIGSFFYPGKKSVGTLVVKDLGYPEDVVQDNHDRVYVPSADRMKRLVPPRKPAGSKFDHGQVCMVCGSRGMSGSAALAANAALRSGCGMVHAAIPASIVEPVSNKVTEVVLHALEETEDGSAGLEAYPRIAALAQRMQCLCVGPGISRNHETGALVRKLVSQVSIPLLLDADGINAYKGCAGQLKNHAGDCAITPHAGEWERLFGALPADPAGAFKVLREKAGEFRLTILYKGNPVRIADPRGNCYVVPAGNSGMATAGSGDVLCGIIASLVAQGCPVADAVLLGAAIHGDAGDAAARALTEYCMTASDIIAYLHEAFSRIIRA